MHCWDAEREKQGSSADEVNGRGQMKDGLLAQFQPLPLQLQMAAGDSWATGACVRLQRLMRDPDRPPLCAMLVRRAWRKTPQELSALDIWVQLSDSG
jgi:hypothetical protein